MPTCPRCAETTGDHDRFCLTCGEALTEAAAATRPRPTVDHDATDTALPVVAGATDVVDLVACPRCGSSNAARRRQCGRCGKVLLEGVAAEPLPRSPDDLDGHDGDDVDRGWDDEPGEAAPGGGHRGRGRGVAIGVVGLGVILGTVLGLAAGMGTGPFARVEPVPFDPAAYPGEQDSLLPATAGSSSTAEADGARSFGPELTVDRDLTTAWIPDGEEQGALLRHGFVVPVWIDRIDVATGDQLDETTFASTGRVTEVMVDLGTQRLDVTLAGMDGVQVVRLPEPVLAEEVTWEVTRTSGGIGAVAEVTYVGWRADERDQEAFHARQ